MIALPRYEGGNKGSNFKEDKQGINSRREQLISAMKIIERKTLFDKWWPLLDLRAELDLRLIKSFTLLAAV